MSEPKQRRIAVFCGSRLGRRDTDPDLAYEMGRAIAARGWDLVYGGGSIGLMGRVADGTLDGGREVIGVIPKFLSSREIEHRGVTELREVETMHERKALMADLSDGFIAIPGGYGTLDELFEIVTWRQLGLHSKPIVLLNAFGFFDPLIAFIDAAVQHDYVGAESARLIHVSTTCQQALDYLAESIA